MWGVLGLRDMGYGGDVGYGDIWGVGGHLGVLELRDMGGCWGLGGVLQS